jgi:ribonucleoside-diphosphate reductase alpha chain
MTDEFSRFAELTYNNKYRKAGETWVKTAWRVATEVYSAVDAPNSLVQATAQTFADRKALAGGRYFYAAGLPIHQCQNCSLYMAEDSREGWSSLFRKASLALMTGAGIGVVYSNIREEGADIKGTGGIATGPIALMQILNEMGRGIMQGGSRRSAIWAGLHWNHPDIEKFIHLKNWKEEVRDLKARDFNFPATMDMTNISVILDDEFFAAYHDNGHPQHVLASTVYWETIERMLRTSEPGFSVDVGENAGEHLRNACTEITSRDDSDICNLISGNMARIESHSDMERVMNHSTAFAIAGSVYSDLPHEEIRAVREKNRRIGVGLMGLHEWLLVRGKKYGPDAELEEYLKIYRDCTDVAARDWAREWRLSEPIKKRAIAPTGTISIVAGPTTSGIEPLFCASYMRRYLKGKTWCEEYVIDPVVKRLVAEGHDPADIEDAYTIDTERRLEFQAWVQQYVDHAISSTINLPAWGTERNNKQTLQCYGNLFMKYLPRLRGLTCYADGSRSGQPLTPVPYNEALAHTESYGDVCDVSGKGGSCGA